MHLTSCIDREGQEEPTEWQFMLVRRGAILHDGNENSALELRKRPDPSQRNWSAETPHSAAILVLATGHLIRNGNDYGEDCTPDAKQSRGATGGATTPDGANEGKVTA